MNPNLKPLAADAPTKNAPPVPTPQTTGSKEPHLPTDGPWSDVLVARLMGRVNRILYGKKKKR